LLLYCFTGIICRRWKPFLCAPVKGCFTVPAEGIQEYIECEGVFRVPNALFAHVIEHLLSFLSTAQPATASGIDTASSHHLRRRQKQSKVASCILQLRFWNATVPIYSAGLLMLRPSICSPQMLGSSAMLDDRDAQGHKL